MSAKVFLSVEWYKKLEAVLPLERWFRSQREALGNEAWTYAMLRVAGAENILQWGFDETSVDGHELLNQWAMLMDGEENDD